MCIHIRRSDNILSNDEQGFVGWQGCRVPGVQWYVVGWSVVYISVSQPPGREKPEETTICWKVSLVQRLITNLHVILYLSTCHIVYISVLILLMLMS